MANYLDATCDVTERVADLLGRMTLVEKCGQLNQRLYGWDTFVRDGEDFDVTAVFKDEVTTFGGIGALYGLFRADPWSGMNHENGISRENSARVANLLQRYVMENTRLGIPMLISEEVPHGHQALDSESYPVNLARGASFNRELQREIATAIATEIRDKGVHLALASALDIMRDPRWGRAEECFSEDPYLAAEFTKSITTGFQESGEIAVILKHFAAQGEPVGGHNSGPVSIGMRELREIFLPPMVAATDALGVMAAYNEIDGVPCHANADLLTGILRDELGFEGIVMADGCALDRLLNLMPDTKKAAALGLTAGVDLSLWDSVYPDLAAAVTAGEVGEALVDRAVSRVLRLKFELGLFEKPYVTEKVAERSASWRIWNLQAAREAICLLENRKNVLPLRDAKHIAVIGPNADALYNQLGDYTAPQNMTDGVTILQGLQNLAPENVTISYEKGSEVREKVINGVEKAVQLANSADVIVLALGGSSARNFDMEFLNNGAVSSKGPNMDAGENVDVADLALPDAQIELFQAVRALGKPVVVVLVQGRPNAIPEISEQADALLTAWYPGAQGGTAVAEVLFGMTNPSGKLPVSIPRSSGQLPVYYNQKVGEYKEDYFDERGSALYNFGYGLSYSDFEYQKIETTRTNLTIAELEAGEQFEFRITIANKSDVAGQEVVQLYIHDEEASITRRKKELKDFQKIEIGARKTQEVILKIGLAELQIWSIKNRWELEAGNVRIFVGGGSDTTLETMIQIKNEVV
ncbi:glycoside hydrolase family 3 C-terminal domain-containing protein [Listeria riparia]|nr:glycoside hydrolase family 3 N-terminal domain-containing protein [Listeria riparia]